MSADQYDPNKSSAVAEQLSDVRGRVYALIEKVAPLLEGVRLERRDGSDSAAGDSSPVLVLVGAQVQNCFTPTIGERSGQLISATSQCELRFVSPFGSNNLRAEFSREGEGRRFYPLSDWIQAIPLTGDQSALALREAIERAGFQPTAGKMQKYVAAFGVNRSVATVSR